MRVVIVFRDIQNGGVQRNLIRLAARLAADGHAVDFLVAESGANEFEIPPGVTLHRAETRNPVALLMRISTLYQILRPDIVYTAMPNYNGIAIIARLLAAHRPNIIISERSDIFSEVRNARPGLYKLSIYLAPLLYRFADRILAVSDETADSLATFIRIPRAKITVMHNPVVSDQLRALATAPVRHPWLDPQFELILAVGRLVRQKDYPTLLRAFQTVHGKRPQARLIIIGEGPDRAALEDLTAQLGIVSAVAFMGFDANPYRWMTRCMLFVLTSLWEGLPTVIIEAMACGATIVATDSPSGPRQVIGDDKLLGYLAPMQLPAAIATTIIAALDNPLPRARLVSAADKYSEQNAMATFYRVANELLQKAK